MQNKERIDILKFCLASWKWKCHGLYSVWSIVNCFCLTNKVNTSVHHNTPQSPWGQENQSSLLAATCWPQLGDFPRYGARASSCLSKYGTLGRRSNRNPPSTGSLKVRRVSFKRLLIECSEIRGALGDSQNRQCEEDSGKVVSIDVLDLELTIKSATFV